MTEPAPITGELVESESPTPAAEDGVVVRNPQGWSLVQHGNWEVSIGPDGMVMLPRHLAPDEVADFIAAVTKAAEVGAETQAANQATAAAAQPTPGLSTLIIQESGQPTLPGAIPLQPSSGGATPSVAVTRLDMTDPTAEKSPTLPRPPAAT